MHTKINSHYNRQHINTSRANDLESEFPNAIAHSHIYTKYTQPIDVLYQQTMLNNALAVNYRTLSVMIWAIFDENFDKTHENYLLENWYLF